MSKAYVAGLSEPYSNTYGVTKAVATKPRRSESCGENLPETTGRVVTFIGARTREDVLAGIGTHACDEFSIRPLPHRLAGARFGAFPERTTDLRDGRAEPPRILRRLLRLRMEP
jgi:hypothetical protein